MAKVVYRSYFSSLNLINPQRNRVYSLVRHPGRSPFASFTLGHLPLGPNVIQTTLKLHCLGGRVLARASEHGVPSIARPSVRHKPVGCSCDRAFGEMRNNDAVNPCVFVQLFLPTSQGLPTARQSWDVGRHACVLRCASHQSILPVGWDREKSSSLHAELLHGEVFGGFNSNSGQRRCPAPEKRPLPRHPLEIFTREHRGNAARKRAHR